MPMLIEVSNKLITDGAVTADTVRGGLMPGTPDNVVVLFEQQGFEPERAMGRVAMVVLNLQVIVRNLSYPEAESKAKQIWLLLDRFKGVLGGVQYHAILARTFPFSVGQDENKRHRWSCNYVVHKDA